MCVCVCVHQLLACSHVNLSPVQARITKFGPEQQITLVNISIVCFFVCFVVVVVFVCFFFFFFFFFFGGGGGGGD